MQTVFAYLDPGTGSLVLQTIVVGGSGFVVFGRYVLTMCTRYWQSGHKPARRRGQLQGSVATTDDLDASK